MFSCALLCKPKEFAEVFGQILFKNNYFKINY